MGIVLITRSILFKMSEIFGNDDYPEKKILKRTLLMLSISSALKIVFFIVLLFVEIDVIFRYYVLCKISSVIFWIVIDLVPILYLYKTHYTNFISIEGNEYLTTEYPDS